MSAAEKKKYEEELKKKQEEELLKLQSRTPAEIEKEQKKAQQKEEETRKRLQAEYFDYKTTQNYLQNIQKLGQIYVNDAPLASLTTSNTVADLRFNQHVMGVKMTEEIRKLAQFFLKPFPFDVNMRHVKKPQP